MNNRQVRELAKELGFTFARRRQNGLIAFTHITYLEERPSDLLLHTHREALAAVLVQYDWKVIRKRVTVLDGKPNQIVTTISAYKETADDSPSNHEAAGA